MATDNKSSWTKGRRKRCGVVPWFYEKFPFFVHSALYLKNTDTLVCIANQQPVIKYKLVERSSHLWITLISMY